MERYTRVFRLLTFCSVGYFILAYLIYITGIHIPGWQFVLEFLSLPILMMQVFLIILGVWLYRKTRRPLLIGAVFALLACSLWVLFSFF